MQAERNMEYQKNGEMRGRGRNSPNNVPTPSRGGRSGGDRRERTCTALEDLMRKRGVDEAWNELEKMLAAGTATDKYTVSRMLMKTVGDGRSRMNTQRVYRAITLAEKFIEVQPKDVDEVLLNALLDTCCRLKDLNRLESIMQRMRDLKVTPSPVTLGILVKTYGQAGDIQKVLAVWNEMENQRENANAVTYGCMIDACVKCNHLHEAVKIFTDMRPSGKHRNTILYTTLIKGYGLNKDLPSALGLFREMPRENVPYNTITYNSMIDACVKGGDLVTAEALLREICSNETHLEPDLITFSTLLKGYCHEGDLDKALQLVEAIKMRGLHCDELVYNTLMDGCVKANDVTAGVGLFEEMVNNGMRPSGITHSILSRLYQRAGYEDDASEAVAQLYQHHGIEKPIEKGPSNSRRPFRNDRNDRKVGPSPTASPMSGYGMQQDYYGSWNEAGWDGMSNHSGASTPCGSPMHHPVGGHSNGLFLPLEAMRGMPPPLPGMDGSGTPYSYGSATPGGSAYGSFAGSPCMSPAHGMEQQLVPASPSQMQYQGMPQMPPFPFTAPGAPMHPQQCTAAGMDASAPQFYAVPMPQPVPNGMPGMAPMMQGANGEQSPMSYAAWQAPAEAQQSPFPMPLSSPHDLAQTCPPSQPPQAFFALMPDAAQTSNAPAGAAAGQSPFCL